VKIITTDMTQTPIAILRLYESLIALANEMARQTRKDWEMRHSNDVQSSSTQSSNRCERSFSYRRGFSQIRMIERGRAGRPVKGGRAGICE
jgi:hypothetical protein